LSLVAVIQARTRSTRLPGKVLMPLGDGTVLACVVARVQASNAADRIVVAVPDGSADDALAKSASALGVDVARGPEQDVLARTLNAVRLSGCTRVMRVTSDCPMIDPQVIRAVVGMQATTGAAYASTALDTGYPTGYDVEVLPADLLELADRSGADTYEREHVTPYIWRRPEQFPAVFLDRKPDRRAWRLVVDTADDYQLAVALYSALGHDPVFGLGAVEALFSERPDLPDMNRTTRQTPYVPL
jgi:spore coat polysaccharide biosynthesis protein SpsF